VASFCSRPQFVVIVALVLLQQASNFVLDSSIEHQPPVTLGPVPRCIIGRDHDSCITFIYGPPDVPYVQTAIALIAASTRGASNLDVATDFATSGQRWTNCSGDFDCITANIKHDQSALYNYTLAHPNQTSFILLFTSAYFVPNFPDDDFGTVPDYLLMFNGTDPLLPLLAKRAVDDALLKIATGNESATIQIDKVKFPKVRFFWRARFSPPPPPRAAAVSHCGL
jgi:hypothetical protein